MTIHHDKLAYGRLKGLSDEMSADEIAKLVEQLNEDEDGEDEVSSQKRDNAREKGDGASSS